MKIRLELLSDTIFGSGRSIPGAEDIAILHDKDGFPYLKGATFKGVLREEAENYLNWLQMSKEFEKNSDKQIQENPRQWLETRFGKGGMDMADNSYLITVSDFTLPSDIRRMVKEEHAAPEEIFTSLRTFTKLKDGIASDGSLRIARCINKGFVFYGDIRCHTGDEELLTDIIGCMKWMGSMRTRGFGRVKVTVLPNA